ncbi:hypothetical protein WR25_17772 [Diploscapter pachys]|uniref:ubiquitinyl hydrolase 1 n=1 Tax=Diploscapter pachys TaxID=2018661 RepID=A0A2A2LQB8_9BILA|nr:hypothetical protein WR25_17772 [Diploscapter pachys]
MINSTLTSDFLGRFLEEAWEPCFCCSVASLSASSEYSLNRSGVSECGIFSSCVFFQPLISKVVGFKNTGLSDFSSWTSTILARYQYWPCEHNTLSFCWYFFVGGAISDSLKMKMKGWENKTGKVLKRRKSDRFFNFEKLIRPTLLCPSKDLQKEKVEMSNYSPAVYVPGQGFVVEEPFMSFESLVASAVLGGAAAAAAVYFYSTSTSKYRERTAVGVPGLYNLGNTCYANSLLQGLASSPSIHKWLTNLPMEHIKDGLLDAMREVIQGLNNPEEATLSAVNIATALSQHRWNITIGSEQDLYELFNVFVTTWDDELQYLKKCLMTSSLLELHLPSSSASESPSTSKASTSGLLTPILRRRGQEIKQLVFDRCCSLIRLDAQLRPPCLGYTSTQYRCSLQECGYKTTKFESFTALTLMIPKAFMGQSFSLEKLLRRYFCMELIRDAVCEKCKKEGKQTTGLFRKHGFSKVRSFQYLTVKQKLSTKMQ